MLIIHDYQGFYFLSQPNKQSGDADSVQYVTVSPDSEGQRIDNFLCKNLSGVPKTHIYKLLRSGQVRVNKGRIKPLYRLRAGDQIRIPPVRTAAKTDFRAPDTLIKTVCGSVISENDDFLVFDKPVGLAVHKGSGVAFGLIETARQGFNNTSLELVHRLDKDTSGCLLVAKSRKVLLALQEEFRKKTVQKEYLVLSKGYWAESAITVDKPLRRNILRSGERMVQISADGKSAISHFSVLKQFKEAALVSVRIETGRTHQIRVHAASLGHPVIGDQKYGDDDSNKHFRSMGLKRMYLHAEKLKIHLHKQLMFHCPPDTNWLRDLEKLGIL